MLHGVEHELGHDDAQRNGLGGRQLDLVEVEIDGPRLLAGLLLHARQLPAQRFEIGAERDGLVFQALLQQLMDPGDGLDPLRSDLESSCRGAATRLA
jgi:hypothetical protein